MARAIMYGDRSGRSYGYATNGSAAVARQTPAQRASQYAPQRAPQQTKRKSYRVIPGQGTDAKRAHGLSLGVVRSFKSIIVFAVCLLAVCGVRVWMSVSTVQALQASSNIQTQIEDARAAGNELEIEHSVLANPTRIQKQAKSMGMSSPKSTEQITVALPPSTKTFRNGGIDIKSTVKSIENSARNSK